MQDFSTTDARKRLGAWAEAYADQLFFERGYKQLEKNARSAGVECDRIYIRKKPWSGAGWHEGESVVFAEIKCRTTTRGWVYERDALRRFLAGKQFRRQHDNFQRYALRLQAQHRAAEFFHVLVWMIRPARSGPELPENTSDVVVTFYDLCTGRLFQL